MAATSFAFWSSFRMRGVGVPTSSKDPLGDIQQKIDTAASRAAFASEIIADVIATSGDPEDARVACESSESLMKSALRLIRQYKP